MAPATSPIGTNAEIAIRYRPLVMGPVDEDGDGDRDEDDLDDDGDGPSEPLKAPPVGGVRLAIARPRGRKHAERHDHQRDDRPRPHLAAVGEEAQSDSERHHVHGGNEPNEPAASYMTVRYGEQQVGRDEEGAPSTLASPCRGRASPARRRNVRRSPRGPSRTPRPPRRQRRTERPVHPGGAPATPRRRPTPTATPAAATVSTRRGRATAIVPRAAPMTTTLPTRMPRARRRPRFLPAAGCASPARARSLAPIGAAIARGLQARSGCPSSITTPSRIRTRRPAASATG